MRLSGLGIVPQTQRPLVQFLVRAHALVVGQVPRRQMINVFLANGCSFPSLLSLPCPLSKDKKENLKNKIRPPRMGPHEYILIKINVERECLVRNSIYI